MSYHKSSNFGEKLNSDLNAKVNTGLKDVIEWNLDCVCAKTGAREATVTAPTEATADKRWLFTIHTENAEGKTT
jgi:hypothetical protein